MTGLPIRKLRFGGLDGRWALLNPFSEMPRRGTRLPHVVGGRGPAGPGSRRLDQTRLFGIVLDLTRVGGHSSESDTIRHGHRLLFTEPFQQFPVTRIPDACALTEQILLPIKYPPWVPKYVNNRFFLP